jgi:hypothetical protein
VILFQEEEHFGCTDGTFNGRRYFQCNPRKAMFVSLNMCQKDGRFQDVHPALNDTKVKSNWKTFYTINLCFRTIVWDMNQFNRYVLAVDRVCGCI